MRALFLISVSWLCLGTISGCATRATDQLASLSTDLALPYTVQLDGAPSEAIDARLRESMPLFRFQQRGVPSAALLRRRARGDEDLVRQILRSEGYYEADIDITAQTTPLEARISISPGPAFTLAQHEIALDAAPVGFDAEALQALQHGARLGERAVAAEIVDTEARILRYAQEHGYPYAKNLGRRIAGDRDGKQLRVQTQYQLGPPQRFGPLRIVYDNGPDAESSSAIAPVDEQYLRSYLGWERGDVFSTSLTESFRQDIAGTGLFSSVAISWPSEAPSSNVTSDTSDGGDTNDSRPETAVPELPLTLTLRTALARSASVGLRQDSDSGASIQWGLRHRNAFGAGERFDLAVQWGESSQSIGVELHKPQFTADDRYLRLRANVVEEEDYRTNEVSALIERQINTRWTAGLGGRWLSSESITGNEDYTLWGVPFYTRYDSSDDVFAPTRGTRLNLGLTPYRDADDAYGFTQYDASLSRYRSWDQDTLAVRARAAALSGADLEQIPPPQRLYAGGGGSVRGYASKSLAPDGALASSELSVEWRRRWSESLGSAVFVEGASMNLNDASPQWQDPHWAAGFGVRYFSPIGPVRLDFARPWESEDGDWQFYLSIGEAF